MILLDGPMGTELERRGVPTPAPGWSAYAIESAPDVVRSVHTEYFRAGAEIHRTNTFRTQPRIFADKTGAMVERAVAIARSAAPGRRIAGSLAPIEDCYRPDLAPAESVARSLHRQMTGFFGRASVDLVICETFPSTVEARIAVEESVRTGLETWVALTGGPDGSLLGPDAMERGARDCVAAGATAVFVCCTGVALTLPYVERLARIGVPVGAYANAFGAGTVEQYVASARAWIGAGATIVGSCCGTGPAHIAALAELR